MTQQYTLRVKNGNPHATGQMFGIFTLPVLDSGPQDPFAVAWIAQQIEPTHEYSWNWDLTWALTFAQTGFESGVAFTGEGSQAVDPDDDKKCRWVFDTAPPPPGENAPDYEFAAQQGQHDKKTIWVSDTGNVLYDPAVSVGIGLSLNSADPTPVIAAQAGPHLSQTFTLTPTYYVKAGNYKQGAMASVADVTTEAAVVDFEKLGCYDATVTLNPDNTWTVECTQDIIT
ncbi:hypothetical protein ACFVFS_11495 [Kitasatospora sp. NPDC057692]|uniref:hypothetical protein n=1 Tax=Kitasatospora sp. NPDC057692 TaxID=3346215 RepID=UPI003673D41A